MSVLFSKRESNREFLEKHISEIQGRRVLFHGIRNMGRGRKAYDDMYGVVTNVYISVPPKIKTLRARDEGIVFTVNMPSGKTKTIDSCYFPDGLYVVMDGEKPGDSDVAKFLFADDVKWLDTKDYIRNALVDTNFIRKDTFVDSRTFYKMLREHCLLNWVQMITIYNDNSVKLETLHIRHADYYSKTYGMRVEEALNLNGDIEKFVINSSKPGVSSIVFRFMGSDYFFGIESKSFWVGRLR